MCTIYRNTCHFYSHCIESHFHCGPTGFAQAYAEPRCERIDELRLRNDASCKTCIQTRALYEWAMSQDACLQDKLINEIEVDFKTKQSDPPTCLQLEKRGLELMEECAAVHNNNDICNAVRQNSQQSVQRDIEKIARHFRVNSYYATRVERMLKNLVSSCGQEAHIASIAESVLAEGFHSHRIVFCTVIFSHSIIDNATAVEMVADRFERPVEQFSFSGIDESRRCVTGYAYPSGVTPRDDDLLYFITWTPLPDDNVFSSVSERTLYHKETQNSDGGFTDIKFYQYTPLSSSEHSPECGDGQRQAGELCDMGVGNIDTDSDEYEIGCSLTCETPINVECSTQPMGPSHCWNVECGDGIRSVGEECDDKNLMSGDGCSSLCRIESDYDCETPYNSTSSCTHVSDLPQTTPYPAATTSAPSRLSTFTSSSLSNSAQSSSSDSSPSTLSTSSSQLSSSDQSPTVDQLQAMSSQSPTTNLPLRSVALQCVVSVLISWTAASVLLMTR